jgi:SdpC family antimicrobial peptide
MAGVVTAVVISTMVACGDGGGAAPAAAQKPLSGEELFVGLAFREGVIGGLYSELGARTPSYNYTPKQLAAREQSKARLVAAMNKAEPGFFARFGTEMQSGNQLRIGRAMRDGAALLNKVSPKRPEVTAGSTDNTESENTVYENTVSGNSEIGNTAYGNTNFGNTEAGNVDFGNIDSGNFDHDNTASGNTAVGNTEGGNSDYAWTIYGGSDETGLAGVRLAREQLIDLLATRLATK